MDADEDRTIPPAGIGAELGEGSPVGEQPGAEGQPAEGAGISLMITRRQKAWLRERGFSEEAIREMAPAEAHRYLGV